MTIIIAFQQFDQIISLFIIFSMFKHDPKSSIVKPFALTSTLTYTVASTSLLMSMNGI